MFARAQRRLRFQPLSLGVAQAIALLIALQFYGGQTAAARTPAAPVDGDNVNCTSVPILLPPSPNSLLSTADKPSREAAKSKARGARPMSKTQGVASRGTATQASERRPAPLLATATSRPAPPSGAMTRPTTWCDEVSARA